MEFRASIGDSAVCYPIDAETKQPQEIQIHFDQHDLTVHFSSKILTIDIENGVNVYFNDIEDNDEAGSQIVKDSIIAGRWSLPNVTPNPKFRYVDQNGNETSNTKRECKHHSTS